MFKDKKYFLFIIYASAPIAFSVWQVLLNNFVIEKAAFTGKEIGILQSIREVPGFLAFTLVYVLLFIKQQKFSLISLFLMGFGTALVGFFPSATGLYLTTLVMSTGFHYLESLQQSLSLQWLNKVEAPEFFGRLISVKSIVSVITFSSVFVLLQFFEFQYLSIYLVFGLITCLIAIFSWINFPQFTEKIKQHNRIVLRKRYWLFYLLTFLSGARRQIFVVFAGFLLVEKFQMSKEYIAGLFLLNCLINIWIAPKIGQYITRFGERKILLVEYGGLILIFIAYAYVESKNIASVLYLLDHIFFSLAIALKTYFQKIADPQDISSTVSVSFSINHIAAIILPAALGIIWLHSPELVFLIGAVFAFLSFILSFLIPRKPEQGNETVIYKLKNA